MLKALAGAWRRLHGRDRNARPVVVWFTGLSGSGKSTISRWVSDRLRQSGRMVEQLDGDAIRNIFPNTGFTRAERDAHIKRVGYLASVLEKNGVSVVASFVSPYEDSRQFVRCLCKNFVEIHVATPLAVCEQRDVKGLYARARRGEITHLTGIDDPYEPPSNPELVLDTSSLTIEEAGERVLALIRANGRGEGLMDHLDALEHRSVHIFREAYANFKQLGMLWSIGKDSTVMLWLARKAFFGHVPFPLIHIGTAFKIPEMIQYRDRLAAEWNLNLIYGQNRAALDEKRTFPDGAVDRLTCCGLLKTEALKKTLSGEWPRFRFNHATKAYERDQNAEAFTGIIAGVRADEEGSRSKERYFSPRTSENAWEVGDQPPEFWNQYKTEFAPGTHVRIHPLLDWTELNIWEYIDREAIPTVSLYYDRGEGKRYRSLGCYPCTFPVESTARNPREIIAELKTGKFANIAERSGRAQDKDDGGGLETLRRDGYM